MMFTQEVVEEFLKEYKLGKLLQLIKLESGFESDNVKITTERGKFVMRVIYQSPNRVFDTMKIYDILVANGIKTVKPEKTGNNTYLVDINSTESLVVQEFVDGNRIFESIGHYFTKS